MTRYEAIQLIMAQVRDELVVSNIGHPSQELFQIKDRPGNFFMKGSMGLASSIGLGLALAQPGPVVVIEGEGSVLMNLGTLATIGTVRPDSLCLLIIDNEVYGTTGGQPTFTAHGINLADLARDCGIESSRMVRTPEELERILPGIIGKAGGPYCVVIKVSRKMKEIPPAIPLSAESIKERFMEHLADAG